MTSAVQTSGVARSERFDNAVTFHKIQGTLFSITEYSNVLGI
jgi:hypothetical protein